MCIPAPASPGSPPCILVVEDSALTQRFLVAALESEGYQVAAACHGREALDLLEAGLAPDLIVLDRDMPVMDGAQFRREQLLSARYAAIPVLHLSGGAPEEGGDRFTGCRIVAKPVSMPRLAALVREILGG